MPRQPIDTAPPRGGWRRRRSARVLQHRRSTCEPWRPKSLPPRIAPQLTWRAKRPPRQLPYHDVYCPASTTHTSASARHSGSTAKTRMPAPDPPCKVLRLRPGRRLPRRRRRSGDGGRRRLRRAFGPRHHPAAYRPRPLASPLDRLAPRSARLAELRATIAISEELEARIREEKRRAGTAVLDFNAAAAEERRAREKAAKAAEAAADERTLVTMTTHGETAATAATRPPRCLYGCPPCSHGACATSHCCRWRWWRRLPFLSWRSIRCRG